MAKKIMKKKKTVETLTHDDASRKNIPSAEFHSIMGKDEQSPIRVAYARRNRDLDPQLVWRGKDEQDQSDLVVQAPPLYIQEKVHPKILIDDLMKHRANDDKTSDIQTDLFADFNGLPVEARSAEFYQHDANWTNRMILGDSLQVMSSLAEREGLRGKVQCIYIDPPYGISFNSNFQWSTTSRDVIDGKLDHITREPEQVKAFRDTWRDGIHSYLTYLRDRLTVSRDLLKDTGSIFVQMGDENGHRIRSLMDEIFGPDNFISEIRFRTSSGFETNLLSNLYDRIIWYSKKKDSAKYRQIFEEKAFGSNTYYDAIMFEDGSTMKVNAETIIPEGVRFLIRQPLISSGKSATLSFKYEYQGNSYWCGNNRHWKTSYDGIKRLEMANRIHSSQKTLKYRRFHDDYPVSPINNQWSDTVSLISRNYVVETNPKVIERCLLMSTDPGDLVLDPTCGSGTTAYVAEKWGRRWITIDTSRVALALVRARIMGARYPYYLLADSKEGQFKTAEIAEKAPSELSTFENIQQGFVYKRVPHIMLKSIANNKEIEVIWKKYQDKLNSIRKQLNQLLDMKWEEWEIPHETLDDWPKEAKEVCAEWRKQRIARQKEIDASITDKADVEYLYDKPYEDKKKVRVAGPFTIESLLPHRVLVTNENDELVEGESESKSEYGEELNFVQIILENLMTAGVQQAHKDDKINFISLTPWPGDLICAEGRYLEGDEDTGTERRAAIMIGPEFGTVSRPDLVEAAREAGDSDFDVLITCAFNYDAHSTEFNKLGRIPVLKARINADLHMADDLKNTGKGNLFIIFGEPDIDLIKVENDQIQVKINGVDVFHPNTGEVRSDGPGGIALWLIDTNYNEESFFVRHAYFLGANDPYKALKTTLKAEINQDAWETLHSDTSRPFNKPESGRIAVKVINHLGDEVMKVFKVD